jgi:two-component system, LuxR family, sensor kinase FixL
MADTVKILLKNVPFFGHLPEDAINHLEAIVNEKRLKDGDLLFKEGDNATTCYIVKSGAVEILKRDKITGKDVRLAVRGQGEFFGEMSLLEDSPRFASARSSGQSTVIEIEREQFTRLIGKYPALAMKVMEVLSSRLRQSDIQLINDLQRKNEQLESTNRRLQETSNELEQSYANLKTANKFLERIISASQFFIVVTDHTGKIFIFNDEAKRIFGCSFSDIAGENIGVLINPSGKDDVLAEIEYCLEDGKIWRGDLLTETHNHNRLVIELVAARVFDEKGDIFASLFMGRDVTEEKNIERQMIMLERMATRGEMAAEIAHELNNYLSIVFGNLELLEMEMEMGKMDNAPKKIKSMKDGLDRITKFTEGLMMYSRPASKKERFDLNGFLENELFFIRSQNRFDGVDFNCSFDSQLPPVTADKSQIQQAILNLLNNAADAMSVNSNNQKKIVLKTQYNTETGTVKISVLDNGAGFTDESLGKIFRQHFTSKESGHGFGLLAVKRVIKNHGGKVWAERNPEGGAIFNIEFPVTIEQLARVAVPQLG